MAVPMESPYCLIYPTVYETKVPTDDQHHFNTRGNPVGMCTDTCMCLTLLQLVDTQLGFLIDFQRELPHHSLWHPVQEFVSRDHGAAQSSEPLKDPQTGLPFPMEAMGDFCLVNKLFPGVAGDSLMFHEADLAELKEQGFHILTYKAENPPPTEKENTQKSSHPPEGTSKSSDKVESTSSKTSGTTLPQNPDSTIPSKSKGK